MYLFRDELIDLTRVRPEFLTMVFDQSIAFGPRELLAGKVFEKLKNLKESGLSSFACVAQAPFLFVARDNKLAEEAYRMLLERSRLPSDRLIRVGECI